MVILLYGYTKGYGYGYTTLWLYPVEISDRLLFAWLLKYFCGVVQLRTLLVSLKEIGRRWARGRGLLNFAAGPTNH